MPRSLRGQAVVAVAAILAAPGCGSKTGLGVHEDVMDGGREAGPPRDAARPDAPMDAALPGCSGADVVVRYDESGSPRPPRIDLMTAIRIPAADVYFLIDTTGSMTQEISAMRGAVIGLVEALTCPSSDRTCSDDRDCGPEERCSPEGRCASAPEISGCLPDLHVGVGRYAGGAASYMHLLDVSAPSDETVTAIPSDADGVGANEALYNSVSCAFGVGRCPDTGCDGEGRECVGYRPRALPILVAITDEGDECSYGRFRECAATPESTGAILREHGIVFVGIDADARGDREATPFLVALAEEAGSYDAAGAPLVFAGTGSDVVRAVQSGLGSVSASPLRLEVVLEELPGDDGDAVHLVDHVAVDTESAGCFEYRDLADEDGDGRDDVVLAAGPGTTGCFVVVPRTEPPGLGEGTAVLLRARLLAGGATVGERTVCFEAR